MTHTPGPPPPTPPLPPPLKAYEYAARRDWPGYYDAVAGKPARNTLLKALELFEKSPADAAPPDRFAIDLGCGSGRDTLELLNRGWRVLATDSSPEAIDRLRALVPAHQLQSLTTLVAPFEKLKLPPAALINASYALPFCDPAAFEVLWRKIAAAIPNNGRFAGQFFGDRDDWARMPDRTHHHRAQVDQLLRDFIIESLQEVENQERGVNGEIKHWHLFHVVARKRDPGSSRS